MNFSEWVLQELDTRGWSQSDLARASGLTRGTISNLLNEVASPNPQTCIQIAKAFELPPEVVLRKAGILPPRTKIDEDVDRLAYRIAQLPPDDQQRVEAIVDTLLALKKGNAIDTRKDLQTGEA